MVGPIPQPSLTLMLGGSSAAAASTERLVVERDMDVTADLLRLRLADRLDAAVGDAVRLELGYGGDESLAFTGEVTAVKASLPDGAEVHALGELRKLLGAYGAESYQDTTVGTVARDLIDLAGLATGTIDGTDALPAFAYDRRLSAGAHLRELARRCGFELYGDVQGRVMFHAPTPVGATRVEFGVDLLASAGWRRAEPWASVDVGGESPASVRGNAAAGWLTVVDADSHGSTGRSSPHLLALDLAARTRDLADLFARGRLASAGRRARELSVSTSGRPGLELGEAVTVTGFGDQQTGGSGYLRALRHRLSGAEGFVTDLRVAVEGGL